MTEKEQVLQKAADIIERMQKEHLDPSSRKLAGRHADTHGIKAYASYCSQCGVELLPQNETSLICPMCGLGFPRPIHEDASFTLEELMEELIRRKRMQYLIRDLARHQQEP